MELEVKGLSLCEVDGKPAIELTPGPRDPDEDRQITGLTTQRPDFWKELFPQFKEDS